MYLEQLDNIFADIDSVVEAFNELVKVIEASFNSIDDLYEQLAELVKEAANVASDGKYVDKTVAAEILGVTRVTIYSMLADGRLTGAYNGKRVDVRSIAAYMASPHDHTNEAGKGGELE